MDYIISIKGNVSHINKEMYLTFTGLVKRTAGVSGNAVISFTSSHGTERGDERLLSLSHIDSVTRFPARWESIPPAVMFARSLKKRNSSRSVSTMLRGVYILTTCIVTHGASVRHSSMRLFVVSYLDWNEKAGCDERADCWSCSVMCEVLNNKHPVLHPSDPTGLIPQPETSVIRFVFDVAKKFMFFFVCLAF